MICPTIGTTTIAAARVVSLTKLGCIAARIEVAARAAPKSTMNQTAFVPDVARSSTSVAVASPVTAMAILAALPSGCAAHSFKAEAVAVAIAFVSSVIGRGSLRGPLT